MTPNASNNPKFFVLDEGDTMQVGDEYYNPVEDAWKPVMEEFIGHDWNSDESKPVRRPNKDYKPEADDKRK